MLPVIMATGVLHLLCASRMAAGAMLLDSAASSVSMLVMLLQPNKGLLGVPAIRLQNTCVLRWPSPTRRGWSPSSRCLQWACDCTVHILVQ